MIKLSASICSILNRYQSFSVSIISVPLFVVDISKPNIMKMLPHIWAELTRRRKKGLKVCLKCFCSFFKIHVMMALRRFSKNSSKKSLAKMVNGILVSVKLNPK